MTVEVRIAHRPPPPPPLKKKKKKAKINPVLAGCQLPLFIEQISCQTSLTGVAGLQSLTVV